MVGTDGAIKCIQHLNPRVWMLPSTYNGLYSIRWTDSKPDVFGDIGTEKSCNSQRWRRASCLSSPPCFHLVASLPLPLSCLFQKIVFHPVLCNAVAGWMPPVDVQTRAKILNDILRLFLRMWLKVWPLSLWWGKIYMVWLLENTHNVLCAVPCATQCKKLNLSFFLCTTFTVNWTARRTLDYAILKVLCAVCITHSLIITKEGLI